MKPKSTRRTLSQNELKLPKLSLTSRIGPSTHITPPRTFRLSYEAIPSLPPIISLQHLQPSLSTTFLESLIQKYTHSSSQSNQTDLTSKIQPSKPVIFHWSTKSTHGNAPASRVGGTLTCINTDLYLFGGQSGDRLNELRCLKYESLHWETVQVFKSLEMPEPRDGHITLAFKHYLVVYGGAGGFNSVLHTRTCSPLVHLLDTQTLNWKIFKPLGRLPDPRRNHAAALIGNTMLVYGGINNNIETLSDLQGLNLESMQWFTPKLTKDSVKPGPRHSFSLTSVFHPALMKVFTSEIFHLPNIYDEDFSRKTSGVYLFGGMTGAGKVMNDLYIVQPMKKNSKNDKNLLRIIKIEGIGKPPVARYGHSAGLCGKLLIIVGGRNDELYPESRQSSVAEIAAFNIINWRWEIVDTVGSLPASCWGLAACALGSKFLCFGGMNLNSFASNEIWAMETSQDSTEGIEIKKKEAHIRIILKRPTRVSVI